MTPKHLLSPTSAILGRIRLWLTHHWYSNPRWLQGSGWCIRCTSEFHQTVRCVNEHTDLTPHFIDFVISEHNRCAEFMRELLELRLQNLSGRSNNVLKSC